MQTHFLTVLGAFSQDVAIQAIGGEETLSQPYCYQVHFRSAKPVDYFEEKMHQPFVCLVGREAKQQRYISGIITDLNVSHSEKGLNSYTVSLQPSIALLKLGKNSAVFQNKNTPDVVCELLRQQGITDIELNLQARYQPLPYRLQYRESDFDFIHRILEEAGIYYYFRHSAQGHTLVLADNSASHPPSSTAALPYRPVAGEQEGWGVDHWDAFCHSTAASAELRGIDWKQSSTLFAESSASGNVSSVQTVKWMDIIGTDDKEVLKTASRLKIEQLACAARYRKGQLSAWWMSCGEQFSLTHHPKDTGGFVISTCSLEVVNSETSNPESLSCQITAFSKESRFYPPVMTPVPEIAGVIPALVVGPETEEIHTDEQGRIKIQFFWDRLGKRDDSSSCWVRVAQSWAGNRFGASFIPRTGSEVLVSFLHGHPDCPLVTGCVYNGKNPPPFSLPGNKNKSGFQSRSFPDGTVEQGNQLCFDDTKDEEQLILGAERDLVMMAKQDLCCEISHNVRETIGKSRSTTIEEGDDSTTLKKGNRTTNVTGNYKIELSGGDYRLQVSGGGSLSRSDKACEIESAESLTLKVGDSKLVITPSEITLKAASISLESQANMQLKGGVVELKATGVAKIDGSQVMIG